MRLLAHPTADLGRLPIALDLRAVNVAEGVRAALGVAAIVALGEWLEMPALGEAALGALLTCLCDAGGPVPRRVPVLLCFAVAGAIFTAGFGLLRGAGLPVVVPVACLAVLCLGMARVWGQSAMQVGNLLTVVLVLALDRTLDGPQAAVLASAFAGGSLWALLLTMVIWRVHPFQPARNAVSDAMRRLLGLANDLSALLSADVHDPTAWEAHARAHRRAARDAIERARSLVLDTVRVRGPATPRAGQSLIQVEAADQLLGALIALSDVLEFADDAVRMDGAYLLHRLVLVLGALVDDTRQNHADEPQSRAMLEKLIAGIGATLSPALQGVARAIAERLRVAAKLTTREGLFSGPTAAEQPWQDRVMAPLRANLSWQSAALRHALRAAFVAAPALVITLRSGNTYAHWLTITLVLTMQPFFAVTWQRALERIGGTVLGGLVAAALGLVLHTPLATAAALFPLAVLAFTVRGVSFGLFMVCLTPLVVLLSELGRPGESELVIAGMRALYTVAGGTLAVAGAALLWPSWEPDRLTGELRKALVAHAAYANAVLAKSGAAAAARRSAGMASNNLEASLSRALQEPRRRVRAGLEPIMVIDAALRRVAGRLAALSLEPTGADPVWREWIAQAWAALIDLLPLPPRPDVPAPESLVRVARQLELMEGVIGRALAR